MWLGQCETISNKYLFIIMWCLLTLLLSVTFNEATGLYNQYTMQKMFVGHAPDYSASLLTPASPASDIPSRSSLRSSSNWLDRTKNESEDLFLPHPMLGIGCRPTWNSCVWLLHSRANWRVFCFMLLTPGTLCELWNAPSVWLHYKSLLLLLRCWCQVWVNWKGYDRKGIWHKISGSQFIRSLSVCLLTVD